MHKNLADDTHSIGVGTAGTGVTATEYGDGKNHVTRLVLADIAFTIGDDAALADSALIYTLPAGGIIIHGASCSVGLTLTTGTPTTDTPEIGLGTTAASGANATLGAVAATAEDIAGPSAMDDIAGTAEAFDSTTAGSNVITVAGAHTVYLNIADTWADVDNTAATASGTVWLNWTLLG